MGTACQRPVCTEPLCHRAGPLPRCPTTGPGGLWASMCLFPTPVGWRELFQIASLITPCWPAVSTGQCFAHSPVAWSVKNLPAVQETWVQFLGWEDPLEKEMATHSSILARRIPRTEEPGGLQSVGSESDTTERLTFSLLHYSYYTNITSFKVLTLEASHMYF